MKCKIIIVVDTLAHGFIKVLNKTARRVCVKYVVFVAQDAIAGMNWLKMAYQDLERTGKGLLAFNDGKWQGVIASFGMVRVSWSYKLYGNSILYPGYRSHCADDELTFISRARNQWVYNPNILLVEVDYNKGMRGGGNKVDRTLFFQRMATGFEQKVNYSEIRRLSSEYNAIIKNMSNGSSVRKGDKLKKKKTSIAFKGHKPLPRPVVNPKKMIMLVSGASGSGKTNFSQRVFHDQLLFISLDQLTVDSSHEIKPILEKMDEIMKSLSKNSIEETFKKGMRRVNLLIPTVINYRKTFIQYLITIIRQSKSEFIVIDSIYFEYPEFHSEFMDQCENEFIIWNTTRII